MGKNIAGVVGGLIVWFVVATVANLVVKLSWPDYAAAMPTMSFTLGMMLARLALGALSSLCAGFTVVWITGRRGVPVYVVGVILIVCFVPIHYMLWDKFPAWYHLTFLVSLLPLTLLGAALKSQRDSSAPLGSVA